MNTFTPKIIFFDIDDTLYIKDERRIPDSVPRALHALKQQGIITAIATGRTRAVIPAPVQDLIAQCGIDLIVSINGQHISHRNQLLAHFPMPPEEAGALSQLLHRHNISHGFVADSHISAARFDEHAQQAIAALGLPYANDPEHFRRHPVYQMLAFYPPERRAEVRALVPPHIRIVHWHSHGADLIEQEGSKARGIRTALATLGIDISEAMAFGDGHNDMEMLQNVGFGVAMGNAVAELKAIARHTAPAAADDGIYRALCGLGVIPA